MRIGITPSPCLDSHPIQRPEDRPCSRVWGGRRSWDLVCLFQSFDVMLEPGASAWIDCKILHLKLLSSRPPHHGFRNLDPLLIRQRDGQREGSSWPHGQIIGESPAGTRDVPHDALALERPGVIRGRALHGETAEGSNREGHSGLAGRPIVGETRTKAQ